MSTFDPQRSAGQEHGSFISSKDDVLPPGSDPTIHHVTYQLLRCSGCNRGGFAAISDDGRGFRTLLEFHPVAFASSRFPSGVPADIIAEFREAELCWAHGAFRGASALLRSTLEKTMMALGYRKNSLAARIRSAVADRVLTSSLGKRADEYPRTLGNDVLHEPWRAVTSEEVEACHGYTAMILSSVFDDWTMTEKVLVQAKRLNPDGTPTDQDPPEDE